MAEELDDVRADLARTTELAKLLFEQQFIRCGGRQPADPEWEDLGEDERDEWWERAVDARPLIDSLLWLHAEAVWERRQANLEIERVNGAWREVVAMWEQGHQNDVLPYTAKLEDEIAALNVAVAEERASRQAWAEEAMRLDHEVDIARGAEGKVLAEYEKLLATYELKLNDFARETLRVSAALQACDPDKVPIYVVGEALSGWEAAQRYIAKAINSAVPSSVLPDGEAQ